MIEQRNATIYITEYEEQTVLDVRTSDQISFALHFAPKKFSDPEVADLRKIVESQRQEIVSVVAERENLVLELTESQRGLRRNGKTKKPGRARR